MKRFCACFSSITKIFPFSNSLVDDYDGDVDFSFDSILTKQGDEWRKRRKFLCNGGGYPSLTLFLWYGMKWNEMMMMMVHWKTDVCNLHLLSL